MNVSRTSRFQPPWPDEAMDELRPDTRTAVVTLTHDPKLDDPALDRALKLAGLLTSAFPLGSRRTHAARLKRLRELATEMPPWHRIQGPVGLEYRGRHRPGDRALHHRRDRRRAARRSGPTETGGMRFGQVLFGGSARRASWRTPNASASGCIRKGSVLDETAVTALREAGRGEVIVARLERRAMCRKTSLPTACAQPLLSPLLARSPRGHRIG